MGGTPRVVIREVVWVFTCDLQQFVHYTVGVIERSDTAITNIFASLFMRDAGSVSLATPGSDAGIMSAAGDCTLLCEETDHSLHRYYARRSSGAT